MTICVAGQMASGKNTVCQIFETLGWKSIDADIVVHEAVKKLTPEILAAFSEDAKIKNIPLTNSDGSLDRRALGSLIFGNASLVARQEAIVYPEVIRQIKDFCAVTESHKIINATLLYKTPELLALCDTIVFVTAPFFSRLSRAKKRDGIPLTAILARFKSQKNLLAEYKKAAETLSTENHKIAIHTIYNSGGIKKLEKEVKKASEKLIVP